MRVVYYVGRDFNIGHGRTDFQWVSHVTPKGRICGYSKDIDGALELTQWQYKRVISELKFIGCKWRTEKRVVQ